MKLFPFVFLLPLALFSQSKKTLDHAAYDEWRRIDESAISNDGKALLYIGKPNGVGNTKLTISNISGEEHLQHDRSSQASFSNNSQYTFFKVAPDFYELRDLKRKKTKEENLPPDTLAIFNIEEFSLEKISGLKSFKVPKKWDDYLVYQFNPEKDSIVKKQKKRNKKNGFDLAVRSLVDQTEVTIPYVLDYEIAEEGSAVALTTTGNDSSLQAGVYVFDFEEKSFEPIYRSPGDFYQLTWDKKGNQLSFIADIDTTKALKRDYLLNYWQTGMDSSTLITSNASLKELTVNHQFRNHFSESGNRLFFQTKEFPVQQDTSLLEDEIVNVEVWNYRDQRLHTHQKNQTKEDAKFGYLSYFDTKSKEVIQLGDQVLSSVQTSNQGDGTSVLGLSNYNYRKLISWEGYFLNDLYKVNVANGQKSKVASAVRGNIQMSPLGNYAYWYSQTDSAWFTFDFSDEQIRQLTNNDQVKFYNEKHDTPSNPRAYGSMSWTENDEKLLVYDRYDIWELDPKNSTVPKRLTDGRAEGLSYRYIKLDEEERFIKRNQKLTLKGFYEEDKSEAIFSYTYGKAGTKSLYKGGYSFSSFKKARDSKALFFSQENFQTFPDLLTTDLSFKSQTKVSDVNPQQKDYNWGTIELVNWNSLDGKKLQGMLVKPENFDPTKKYPLIVNFYEKSSDRLNRHREPYPGRSTMNYSFYASRGYVIFNPDVYYRDGYPGESAYNCVVPGVTSLIEKGFIDEENIGVQGHSWGGYQIAYLLSRTNMFKCAEAGAPVVNMISAYGGIRWGTGLSRMFQYERTQSRIGGTLWDYPLRYIENSPIFTIDKVQTPVLILHNDADGAVPWYQGIEYFVALRRLNKPAWMLNYQGEPHWPVKLQNRIDFNIRLAQFFDYYLKGEPMPKWMRDGVPALEVGINQGYELLDE